MSWPWRTAPRRKSRPLKLGHYQIVGRIDEVGPGVVGFEVGQRVGVPWLAQTCGFCAYCLRGAENLCDTPLFTGYTRNGGFADVTIANSQFIFPLGEEGEDAALAPLLCAGLIGWRALGKTGEAATLGLYGFGAAAHIVAQIAIWQGRRVFAFTRRGDAVTQDFARQLGAEWAGGSDEAPPEPLDAAMLFAPIGSLVPAALAAVRRGGRVVCAGIHMSDIPTFAYDLLWGEREIVSVANLTRNDGAAFFPAARAAGIRTKTQLYPLERANAALDDLRHGRFQGAAVLVP